MQTDSELKTNNLQADQVSSLLTDYAPTLLQKYKDWISLKYPDKDSAYMNCHEAVLKLMVDFPELEAVPGYVYVGLNYRPHWWCVLPSGEIVDPTAHQWESKILKYDSWEGEEPIGKCLECGAYSYQSKGGQMYLCENCLGT